MMTYGGIVLAVIQFLMKLYDYSREQMWINEGEAKAYAKTLAENLRKSGYAKQALAEAHAKSDTELDDLLREFEPGAGDKPGK